MQGKAKLSLGALTDQVSSERQTEALLKQPHICSPPLPVLPAAALLPAHMYCVPRVARH